ncbi:MAG: T9SS type A sorting domain-containing protein [Bacteroidia bacterium]|nr:T9SS type A sorting domain-containing protein [Bacteroidia bacterium]
MKTIVFRLSLLLILLKLNTFSQLSFTLNYLSLTTSITCVNPAVIVQAQSNYTGAITYSVVPATVSQSASVFVFTTSATYTITGSAPGQGNFTTTLSVTQNTTPPTSSLTPLYQLITCTTAAAQTMTGTALSPTTNVYHQFHFSNGLSVGPIPGYTAIVQPPPGTHTHVVTDIANGCTVAKTFTVANAAGFPTFTIVSPIQNFSIGCVPKHTVDINITNALADPPTSPVTYTILPPGSSIFYTTGIVPTYTFSNPGQYTVVIRDMVTGCETRSPFSIIQNTVAPSIFVSAPVRTLSCFVPTATLSGFSYNNVSFAWYASPTNVVPGNSLTPSVTGIPSNTILANYTLVALDLNNACRSQSIVPIYQNIFPPMASIAGNTAALNCTNPVILINTSTTGIPPGTFSNSLSVVVTQWLAQNQPSVALSSTYTAANPGSYTMNVQDANNGCTSFTTTVLSINGQSIALGASQDYSINCPGTNTITINSLVSNFSSCTYTWSNSSGSLASGTLTANSGTANASLQVSSPGYYTLSVQEGNCSTAISYPVYACVGIEETVSDKNSILVFPNPSSAQFEILLKDNTLYPLSIEVFNALSQKVMSQEINEPNSPIRLDAAPGVYFISIYKSGQRLYHSKLLKN